MPALCAIFDTVMVRLLSKDETAPAGDGLGVFALHNIQPGERLLAERPLLQSRA